MVDFQACAHVIVHVQNVCNRGVWRAITKEPESLYEGGWEHVASAVQLHAHCWRYREWLR